MSLEAKQPISYNEKATEERIIEIYKNFDWKIFKEIVEEYKYRFDNKDISKKYDALRIFNETDFEIDRDTNSLANISNQSLYPGLRDPESKSTITFNPREMAKVIPNIAKHIVRRENIKINFDLVYLVTIKVLIHELLHREGNLGSRSNLITESIIETMSYIIAKRYLIQTGTSKTPIMEKLFNNVYTFRFYMNEIIIFTNLIELTAKISNTDMYVLRYGFFASFFARDKKYLKQMNGLPDDIRSIWDKVDKMNGYAGYEGEEPDFDELESIELEISQLLEKYK